MKRENKNLMLFIIGLILLIAIVNVSNLFLNKQEELPEVKLKTQEKEKSLAIMVKNENGNGYKEYEGNEWPKDDYYYNHSECIDNNGKKIEGGITFNEEKNTATLTTNKTIYCTLYFDKYNYMKVPLHTISVSDGQITCPDYMSSSIKKIEFVDKLPDLDELQKNENYWDISDTSQGTPSESVIAWIEPIQDDSDYNTLYIGSSTKIRVINLFSAFAASEYENSSSNPISNLESINFNYMLDTVKTQALNQMFRGDINLSKIEGVENWDTSNVINMSFLFCFCKSLTNIDFLSNWDVSNVIYMHYMFQHCEKLSDINGLKKWNVSKVETMGGMFLNCISLSDISALSGWNTIHVTNMDHMFREMSKLSDFSQLSKWNVSNVTSMWRMFLSDSNLETIDISGWDTSKVENMESLFSLCQKIKSIDMRNATFTQITDSANYANMFYNIPNSTIIIVKNQVQKDFIWNNKTNLKFTGTQDKIKLSNEV